jgi:hypothetical protein
VVPVLDAVGGRWQWGTSRFNDVRFGFGALYSVLKGNDGVDHWNLGGEANLSVATFHLGLAYTPFRRASFGDLGNQDRFRMLIGADLYKLIAGGNLELSSD